MSEAVKETSDRSRKHPRSIKGLVVSDKNEKTRVILVKRRVQHKLYHKGLIRNIRIPIHDEKNQAKVGDTVIAIECRPYSKQKHFRLKSIEEKGQ